MKGRTSERISTALSRKPPGLSRKSKIIHFAHDAVNESNAFVNSETLCSPKYASPMYPILPESIRLSTEGTRTVSRTRTVEFSRLTSQRRNFTVIFDPFGPRILSTASSVFIQTSFIVSTIVRISPSLSHPFSAGEFLSIFLIFIPFGC